MIEPAPGTRVVQCRPLQQLELRGVEKGFDALLGSRKLIYVSFGSYAKEPKLAKAAEKLLDVLLQWSALHDGIVACTHQTLYKNSRLLSLDSTSYVPYSYVAKRASLVVFTGSLCLQNACRVHDTPMLFVPFLTEQYFWAKNYFDSHGHNYVDKSYFPTLEDIDVLARSKPRRRLKRPLLPTVGDTIVFLGSSQCSKVPQTTNFSSGP
jgi:hypothetical protein